MVEFEYTTPGSKISEGAISTLIDGGAASAFGSLRIPECSSRDCRIGSSRYRHVRRSNTTANTKKPPMNQP